MEQIQIVVADPDPFDLDTSVIQLKTTGFQNIVKILSLEGAMEVLYWSDCGLLFINDTWNGNNELGFEFIKNVPHIKNRQIVILTSNPSVEQFCKGAVLGIADYLVKGPKLHLGKEAARLLSQEYATITKHWDPFPIGELGFFRTLGLTTGEIEILTEFMRDFPRQTELSNRLGKSSPQLRKIFSSIYKKLSETLAVDNTAQLVRLLTIGSFYRDRKILQISQCTFVH